MWRTSIWQALVITFGCLWLVGSVRHTIRLGFIDGDLIVIGLALLGRYLWHRWHREPEPPSDNEADFEPWTIDGSKSA
jgi:hypothetical protein